MFARWAQGGGHFREIDLTFVVRAMAKAFIDIAATDIPESTHVIQVNVRSGEKSVS
jgi:hypothetical protein